MNTFEEAQTDNIIKALHGGSVSGRRCEIVACRKHVTSVQADADARLILHPIDHVAQLLEAVPHAAALHDGSP